MTSKKVGVLLSGCGVYDGAEIHEAVLTLLYLDQQGAEAVCMAPDINQAHVINHLNQEEMDPPRNVLVEAARIARGEIKNLAEVTIDQIDALILPGGFGAAKNLSEFAFKGPESAVNANVQQLLQAMIAAGKPHWRPVHRTGYRGHGLKGNKTTDDCGQRGGRDRCPWPPSGSSTSFARWTKLP